MFKNAYRKTRRKNQNITTGYQWLSVIKDLLEDFIFSCIVFYIFQTFYSLVLLQWLFTAYILRNNIIFTTVLSAGSLSVVHKLE